MLGVSRDEEEDEETPLELGLAKGKSWWWFVRLTTFELVDGNGVELSPVKKGVIAVEKKNH